MPLASLGPVSDLHAQCTPSSSNSSPRGASAAPAAPKQALVEGVDPSDDLGSISSAAQPCLGSSPGSCAGRRSSSSSLTGSSACAACQQAHAETVEPSNGPQPASTTAQPCLGSSMGSSAGASDSSASSGSFANSTASGGQGQQQGGRMQAAPGTFVVNNKVYRKSRHLKKGGSARVWMVGGWGGGYTASMWHNRHA
jgi:hypothetical protein